MAPLYAVLDLPRHVQVGALALNALLATAVLPASFVLARRAFGLPFAGALAAAAVAATYPAVVLLAGYEWAEPLYQLLFVVWALAVASVLARPAIGARPSAVGVAAAALNATHPRGLGDRRRHRRAAGRAGPSPPARPGRAGLAARACSSASPALVNAALLDAVYSEDLGRRRGRRARPPHRPEPAVGGGAGADRAALVPHGGHASGWRRSARSGSPSARGVRRPLGPVLLAGVLATLAGSALQMADGTRVDHMVYGRYVEGVVPVLLVAGAGAVLAWRLLLPRLLGVVAVLGALLAVLLVGVRGGDRFAGDVMPLNVTGILSVRQDASHVDVLRVSLVARWSSPCSWSCCARWRAVAAVTLVAVLFVASSASVQARTLRPFDRTWAGFVDLPDAVRDLPVRALTIDRGPGYETDAANLYQVQLSDLDVRFSRGRPSTAVVIGPERWPAAEGWGARLVTVETGPVYEQGLWVLPGPAAGPAGRRGPPPPAHRSPTRSPTTAAVSGSTPTCRRRSARASEATVDVEVEHLPGGAAWAPARRAGRAGARARCGSAPAGTTRRATRCWGRRPSSTGSLRGGERTDVGCRSWRPGRPGRYRLTVGMRQEGIELVRRPGRGHRRGALTARS